MSFPTARLRFPASTLAAFSCRHQATEAPQESRSSVSLCCNGFMWSVHLCSFENADGRTIGVRVELVGAADSTLVELKRSWSTPMTGTEAAAAIVVDAVDCGTGEQFQLPLSESKCATRVETGDLDEDRDWYAKAEPNSGDACYGGVNWVVRCGEYCADATDVFSSAHPSMSYICTLCPPGSSAFGKLFDGVGLTSEYVEVYVQVLSVQPCAKVRRRSPNPMARRPKQASPSSGGSTSGSKRTGRTPKPLAPRRRRSSRIKRAAVGVGVGQASSASNAGGRDAPQRLRKLRGPKN